MIISVLVSLYTSRIVLQTLGVEDYGIYSIVGSVVAMFSFLNGTMSGATSRFLTYEMGLNVNTKRLHEVFSATLTFHFFSAVFLAVLTETIGLWFLHNRLVIPEARMYAANWVLQFSIIGAAIGITQVPYNATIIAHEEMDIYACIELLNVFLKLGIVYLLTIGNFDKLILYSGLMLAVNFIIAMTYRIYCLKNYQESHFRPNINKKISKEIISFSLYNLFGNIGQVFNTQGTSFVINMFFGVLYNAAASIGITVSGVVSGFSNNVMVAFRPQITKSYAQDDIRQFEYLLLWAIKSILIIYLLVAIPIGLSIKSILSIWLVDVPIYADVFCRLLLISIFFETLRFIVIIGIHAIGRVKLVSLLTGITLCINPFVIYGLFKMGLSPAYAYVSLIYINIFLSICIIFILKYNEPRISLRELFITTIKIIALAIFVLATVAQTAAHQIDNKFIEIIIICLTSTLLIGGLSIFGVLEKNQRRRVLNILKAKLVKHHNG
jgi:O-antigen/teichoic acid export membrane protein